MKKLVVNLIVFLLVFSLGLACGILLSKNKPEEPTEAAPVPTEDTALEKPEQNNSLSVLKKKLQNETEKLDGEWAVYVEDLSNGDFVEINNKKMVSASLIKLFIMGKIYEETEKGTIQKESVLPDLRAMITVSDNEASNELVAVLGGGEYTDMHSAVFQKGLKQVNAFGEKLGCVDTTQERDMKNSRLTPIPEQNYTSVTDCGRLLSALYKKTLVSETADKEMLELLKQQTRVGKIPAGLPAGTVCANKTGELSDVENDVAIVFSPMTDYVICIMSNEVPSTGVARQNITKLSKMVYDFFN